MLYIGRYILLDQQVIFFKPYGLIDWLETHKLKSDDPIEQVQNNHESTLIVWYERWIFMNQHNH